MTKISKDHVLWIEDDYEYVESLKDALKESKFTLEHIRDPKNIKEKSNLEDFSAIIIDCTFGTGYNPSSIHDVLMATNDKVSVIALTDAKEVDEDVLKAGASMFLRKPVTSKNLSDIVESLLIKQKHEKESDATPRVFISYSHSDKVFVNKLINTLNTSGIEIWIDKWMIKIGDSITDKVNEGIGTSDFLIIVLSKASTKSKWVREELNTALVKNIEQTKYAFILPVIIEDCDIPIMLKHRKYADFRNNPEDAMIELIESIKQHQVKTKNKNQNG